MQDSPLTRKLPAELRNRIYRLVLVQPYGIDVSRIRAPNEPALLATCSQVREEALAVYYSENIFYEFVWSWCQRFNEDSNWLESIGVMRAKLITEYKIHLMNSSMSAQKIRELLTSGHANGVSDIFEQGGMSLKLVEFRRFGLVPFVWVIWRRVRAYGLEC